MGVIGYWRHVLNRAGREALDHVGEHYGISAIAAALAVFLAGLARGESEQFWTAIADLPSVIGGVCIFFLAVLTWRIASVPAEMHREMTSQSAPPAPSKAAERVALLREGRTLARNGWQQAEDETVAPETLEQAEDGWLLRTMAHLEATESTAIAARLEESRNARNHPRRTDGAPPDERKRGVGLRMEDACYFLKNLEHDKHKSMFDEIFKT